MDITVNPGRLSGTVAAPPSKSDLHRKCIAAAFCGDGAAVRAAALCDDTRATLDCLAAMGFSVGFDGESVRIGGAGGEFIYPVVPVYALSEMRARSAARAIADRVGAYMKYFRRNSFALKYRRDLGKSLICTSVSFRTSVQKQYFHQ